VISGKLTWLKGLLGLAALLFLAASVVLFHQGKRNSTRIKQLETEQAQLTSRIRELERRLKSSGAPQPIPHESKSAPNTTRSDHAEPLGRKPVVSPKKEAGKEIDPDQAAAEDLIAWAFQSEFPELDLSERDLRQLSRVVFTMRGSMEQLRKLRRTQENVGMIEQLQEEVSKAREEFEFITGMRFETFTHRAAKKGGIDHENAEDEEIVLEYLDDFKP
jgi:hypothetical protein